MIFFQVTSDYRKNKSASITAPVHSTMLMRSVAWVWHKESKRKFLWHYVPVKERQLLEGDSIGGA